MKIIKSGIQEILNRYLTGEDAVFCNMELMEELGIAPFIRATTVLGCDSECASHYSDILRVEPKIVEEWEFIELLRKAIYAKEEGFMRLDFPKEYFLNREYGLEHDLMSHGCIKRGSDNQFVLFLASLMLKKAKEEMWTIDDAVRFSCQGRTDFSPGEHFWVLTEDAHKYCTVCCDIAEPTTYCEISKQPVH